MNRNKHEMATAHDRGQIIQIHAAKKYLEIKTKQQQDIEARVKRDLFEYGIILACALWLIFGIASLENRHHEKVMKAPAAEKRISE